MPQVLYILATADKDVTVVSCDEPVMKSSCPVVADLSDAKNVTWAVHSLNRRAGNILVVIEQVQLASNDDGCLILLQEEQCVFLHRLQRNLAQQSL